jgi:hypothetical protein
MKPQDILVLVGVLIADEGWRHVDLAHMLHLSQSEVTNSLERSRIAGMIADDKRTVFGKALLEFIEHGLRYVFPARPGPIARGVPTAYSTEPLAKVIRADETDVLVWPCLAGNVRGQTVEPLYPSLPEAALANRSLHAVMSLIDAVRVGQARERQLAMHMLQTLVYGPSNV